MAKISPISLEIVPNFPNPGRAEVRVVYELWASGDDTEAERRYQEVAQLFSMGNPLPNGSLSHEVVTFTANDPAERRSIVLGNLGVDDLKANLAPLQDGSIVARVTLTPLDVSRDSNAYDIAGGTIGPP